MLTRVQCGHIFCNPCILQHFLTQSQRGDQACCHQCRQAWKGRDWTETQKVRSLEPDKGVQKRLAPTPATAPRKRKGKKTTRIKFQEAPNRRPGDDFLGTQPKLDSEDGAMRSKIADEDIFGNGGVPVPSAKTTAVKEIVLRWMKEDPNHRGISKS